MSISPQETLFLTAREAVKRGCIERFRKEHPELPPNTFHTLPILLAPELRLLSWTALQQARGRVISGDTLFTATIWMKGAMVTTGGIAFRRSLTDFVTLLRERSACTAPKRQGWVIEPTTNLDGHRTNLSTTAMHSLFLDCDGAGEWNTLIDALTQLNFCFVAYQSGGWSPTTPKWRVVLPLSTPFLTGTEDLREMWKSVYHHARVVFGSLAYLLGQGFDPATDTPCCPWFVTEKRDEKDTPRQVIWRLGHTLDLMPLVMSLPSVDGDSNDDAGEGRTRVESSGGLSDERLDEIIKALAVVTNSVPSGRHDLYLALPGVMLDRGVNQDDVLAIVDGVSASYPRKHPELHRDNMHNARTTISRWLGGDNVTRIGTVQERWPDIAQVLDEVVPDPLSASLAASTAAMLEEVSKPRALQLTDVPAGQTLKKNRKRMSALGREIAPRVASMAKSTKADDRIKAMLLRRIIDGEPFVAETPEKIDELVSAAMVTLGFILPTATWVQAEDLAHMTLLSMDFTQSMKRVSMAEQSFLKGQQDRKKWNRKQDLKTNEFFKRGENMRKGSK